MKWASLRFATGVEVNMRDSSEFLTPGSNFGRRSDLVSISRNNKAVKLMENDANCSDTCRSPTPPPVQVSVSPEIQGGLTPVVAVTPSTCYAAGNVLSGVLTKKNAGLKEYLLSEIITCLGLAKQWVFTVRVGVLLVNITVIGIL